jgi:hypothetical protein
MVKLLNNGANILMQIKLTNAINAGSVLKTAKKRANELKKLPAKPSSPLSPHKRKHRRKPTI